MKKNRLITPYDAITRADGYAARDRLVEKAREQAATQPARDIAKMHKLWRPRPKPYTFEDMVEDKAPE